MAKAEGKKVKVLRVASTREGFRRAGFTFGREPKDLPLDKLSKDQIEALRNDPSLVCLDAEAEVEVAGEEVAK